MKKLFALLILLLPAFAAGYAQPPADSVVTFRFVPGKDMFYSPWAGNGAEIDRLFELVDLYRAQIADGTMPVLVNGYCASLPTERENRRTAWIRSNRVKSELITRKGLIEDNFITTNHTKPYGKFRDIVLVSFRIPVPVVQEEPPTPEPVVEEPQPEPEPEPVVEAVPEPAPEPAPVVAPEPVEPGKPYCFAVRTNLLYDALLMPTLGVEWRISRDFGIKIDGSGSSWGSEHGKVQKTWLLSPEARWYLLKNKNFYTGVSGNFGHYNVYEYLVGGIVSKDKGYQGTLWNAGLTVGYQLRLARRFALDFNVGLGYNHAEYDSFTVIRGVRVASERNRTKNFWGPTQAGISFVWTIGGER